MRVIAMLVLPAMLQAQSAEQLFRDHRYDDARAAFQARVAKNKGDDSAYFYLGRIAMTQGKTGDAVDWFEMAIAVRDSSALYHDWLGGALGQEAMKASKIRQPFLARRVKSEFERAVQLDPRMIGARVDLMQFYAFAPGIMGGGMDKAQAQAEAIAKLSALQGHLAMAMLARREKDAAREEREARSAVAAAPDSAAGYIALATYYRSASRWNEALATYDSLMKHKPDAVAAHLMWAETAITGSIQSERAEREIKTYFANSKDQSLNNLMIAHWRLGQIYAATGRKELARAEFNESLKINPKFEAAKKGLEALK